MCFDSKARPPRPPVAGAASEVRARDLVLSAEDGARLGARSATHDSPGGPGIVILPDVRGLHPFYRELAERFAEAGVHSTAIDYFARTAGVAGSGDDRGDDFDWQAHVARTHRDTIALDVAAAVRHLTSADGGAAEAVFTVGFCFGGRNSFNQATRGHGLAGVIGFYGRVAPNDDEDATAPTFLAPGYAAPVLGLFGGADQSITHTHVQAFERALDEAGVNNELVIYEGAPHSFFDRTFSRYSKECDDAWNRVLRFIQANGGHGDA